MLIKNLKYGLPEDIEAVAEAIELIDAHSSEEYARAAIFALEAREWKPLPSSYPITLNGDHAEFERDNINTKPEDRADWPLPSFDGREWAKAFCKLHPSMDEGLMISWFCCALMRGFDEHRWRSIKK